MASPTTVLTVPIENTPGKLGEVARAIAQENVNILAIESSSYGEFGIVRIATDQPEKAERALKTGGYTITTGEVLEADLPNRAGELAKLCESLAEANVNIEGLWGGPATGPTSRILLRVDDAAAARRVLQANQAKPQTITR